MTTAKGRWGEEESSIDQELFARLQRARRRNLSIALHADITREDFHSIMDGLDRAYAALRWEQPCCMIYPSESEQSPIHAINFAKALIKGSAPQYNGEQILPQLRDRQRESASYLVVVIPHDLTVHYDGPPLDFAFAQASADDGIVLFSTHRFHPPTLSARICARAVEHVVIHEFGHLARLVRRLNQDQRGGHYAGHCASPVCVMRQMDSIGDVIKEETACRNRSICFCDDCHEELLQNDI